MTVFSQLFYREINIAFSRARTKVKGRPSQTVTFGLIPVQRAVAGAGLQPQAEDKTPIVIFELSQSGHNITGASPSILFPHFSQNVL